MERKADSAELRTESTGGCRARFPGVLAGDTALREKPPSGLPEMRTPPATVRKATPCYREVRSSRTAAPHRNCVHFRPIQCCERDSARPWAYQADGKGDAEPAKGALLCALPCSCLRIFVLDFFPTGAYGH